MLLPEIERHRIWERKKFGSIYEYAAKLAGMSRNTVDDALRILKKIADKPALKEIVAMKGINAVRPVAAVASQETAAFWAEKAAVMSKHTLEVYVKELGRAEGVCGEGVKRRAGEAGGGSRTGTGNVAENAHQQAISFLESGCPKKILAMDLDLEIAEKLEKLKGEGSWNDLLKHLLQMREDSLDTQKPDAVKTESRHIPSKIRRFVFARTNGVCAFPGCRKSYAIVHHTGRFALEKAHDPDRVYGLCKDHERIAHHGLIGNEEESPVVWKVQKEADRGAPKFLVDDLVFRYRRAGR